MRTKKKRSVSHYGGHVSKIIKTNDPNSYDGLCIPSKEPCELCDKVSKNRYDSLIHNVSHIIIPLLNQEVFQCEICLHHFTSNEDLTRHKAKKHTLSELISQTDLVKNNFNNPTDGFYDTDLITIVKEEKKSDPIDINDSVPNTNSNGDFSIKNRLLFEEDIISLDCNRLLTDLTTECQVKVELFPPIWPEEYFKSVHFDELVKPGVFRCKKCGKTFPSRYETIKHESRHIIIKNSQVTFCKICNKYIVGDSNKLYHHKLTSHFNSVQSTKHDNKDIPKKDFGAKLEENGVAPEPLTTKTTTLKLCEICFSFCRNKSLQNYDCIGELSEVGKRYTCEKCGYKFFEVKLVKREIKYRISSFAKKKAKFKKVLSNEDRLKSISHRFKMMRKTYFVVLFTYYLI